MINQFELRLNPENTERFEGLIDMVIDGWPLATYFRGLEGAYPSELVSPLGWARVKEFNQLTIQRFLLQMKADLPNDRQSILICPLCGDLYCGAYSAVFEKNGDFIFWSKLGFESPDWETGSQEIHYFGCLQGFRFDWRQYSSELERFVEK
jgi:hypothetical protein